MKHITTTDQLRAEITRLESLRHTQEAELKMLFHEAVDAIKPSTIIRNTVKELGQAPDFKRNAINAVMSLSAGYLSKRLAFGKQGGIVKSLLGGLLQQGVTKAVANHAESIKSGGWHFFQSLFTRKSPNPEEPSKEEVH